MRRTPDQGIARKAIQLRVPVLPDEKEAIQRLAASAGLPVAAYLRNLGLQYRIEGILDHEQIETLVHLSADLRRLGGLLKLWLADDPRTLRFGDATIGALIEQIGANQITLKSTLIAIVRPSGRVL